MFTETEDNEPVADSVVVTEAEKAVADEISARTEIVKHEISSKDETKTNLEDEKLLLKNKALLKEIDLQQEPQPVTCIHHLASAPELADLDFYQIQLINQNLIKSIKDETKEVRGLIAKVEPLTEAEANQFYFNPKLQVIVDFDKSYTKHYQENYTEVKKHPLFGYIQRYFNIQKSIHGFDLDIKQVRKGIDAAEPKIWTVFTETKTFSGKCCDGKTLSVTKSFNTALYNQNWAESVRVGYANLSNLSVNMHRVSRVLSKTLELVIDQLIITFADSNLNRKINITELRHLLEILFHFMRKSSPNEQVTTKLKHWYRTIISVYNQSNSFENTLFIISHILRCPTSYAVWASNYVEIRPISSSIGSEEVDECLGVLWMLLRPISKWSEKVIRVERDVSQWLLVDSDGEDYSEDADVVMANETILMALLDRIPFGKLFSIILGVELGTVNLNISCQNLLQFTIFCTTLLNILNEGLKNYSIEKYKNFTKRLAGMMKHTADFVSYLYNLYW